MTDQHVNEPPTPPARPMGMPFSTHELLYLLALHPGDEADTTRGFLRLGDAVEPETPLYAAGATTLRVRGMLEIEREQLVPSREVQALTAILTKADRWVEFGLLDEEQTLGALIVSVADYAVMLTAADLGIFIAVPLESADVVPALAVSTIDSFLERSQPAAGSVNVRDALGTRRAVIHRGDDERWQVATDPVDDTGRLTTRDIAAADVGQFVRTLVTGSADDPS